MNTQVSPPMSPPVAPPVAPPALTAEQTQAWEGIRTQLANGNADRATALQSFASPDALFERLTAEPQVKPPTWEEMRAQLAGDDPAAQQFWSKYADPTLATKSVLSLQTKLSEGGRIKLPGEGATPEELAEYRTAMGIPESADKYEITAKPADGYEVTEGDKTVIGGLTNELHELVAKGAKPNDIVNFAVQKYYDVAAQRIVDEEQQAADAAYEGEQANRTLWGPEYESKIGWAIAGAKHFFPGTDAEFEQIMGLKLSSGHAVFDHPLFQRMFAQIGLEHSEDPFVGAMRAKSGSNFDPQARIKEIQGWRNGTTQQREDYAKAAAQGGELYKLQEGLARQQSGAETQRR